MNVLEKIKTERTKAMKNKETVRLSMIRMMLATIETEKGKTGKDLTDERILELITRNRNNLNEEIKSLEQAGRDATLQKQQREVVEEFLPISEEEIREFMRNLCVIM